MKKLSRYIVPISAYYFGGCSVLLGFYTTWFHYYGVKVHTQSILNIVLWPWYLLIMIASWAL